MPRLTKEEKGFIKRCMERELSILKGFRGSIIKVEGFPTLQDKLEGILGKLERMKWDA